MGNCCSGDEDTTNPAHNFLCWGELSCSREMYDTMLELLKGRHSKQLLGSSRQASYEDAIAAMVAVNPTQLKDNEAALNMEILREILPCHVYIENASNAQQQERFEHFLTLVKGHDRPSKTASVVDPNTHFRTCWITTQHGPLCPTWTDVGPNANVVRGAMSLDRFQTTGTCCCLLSLILTHYIKRVASTPSSSVAGHATIDVTEYIRRHVRGDALHGYLSQGSGFRYEDVAKTIFDDPGEPETFKAGCTLTFQDLPVVISTFKLKEGGLFHRGQSNPYAQSNPSVFNAVTSKKIDTSDVAAKWTYHSMLIVGMHVLPNGTRLFLVKNWWPDAPYVVMDDAYLAESHAEIAFPSRPKNLNEFEIVSSAVASTQADAAPKMMAPV